MYRYVGLISVCAHAHEDEKMPKRKRPNETLEGKLPQFKTDLFRALKKVKGFERQRLSRRLHEKGLPEDRKEKYELEVAVLKVCDRSLENYLLCANWHAARWIFSDSN